MKRLQLFIAVMFLAFVPLMVAQYTTTYNYGSTDITSYATSGTNAWNLLRGSGHCLANSFTTGHDGIPRCISVSDGYAYAWANGTWTKQTAMGTGLRGLAANTGGNVYSLQVTSWCTNLAEGYQVFSWNGSVWVSKPGCLVQFQAGMDGILVGIDLDNELWESTNGGANWSQIVTSTGWTFASVEDSITICAVNSGKVYQMVAGVMTMVSPQPGGTLAGCSITQDGPSFMTWTTLGLISLFNYSTNTWKTVSGLAGNSLVSPTKASIFALDSPGNVYHLNLFPLWAQGVITGNWDGCPAKGDPCPPGVHHTGKVQVKYLHSTQGLLSTQVATPFQQININSQDANPFCDPFYGDPFGPECFIGAQQPTDQVICSQSGENLTSAGFSFPCTSNLVPPYHFGWGHVNSINVYIDNHWNSAEQTSICSGISSWGLFQLNSYNCISAYVAPGHQHTEAYIWVTFDPSYVDPVNPRGANFPCGYWAFHGYGDADCPVGGHLKHPMIVLGPYTDNQLEGAAAHEEGHDNFLSDCYSCQWGGSVMGSQGTWTTSQPTSPTGCDQFWAGVYSIF